MGRYIESESELEDLLTTPSPSLISDMTRQPDGDLVVLGAGGKMGPSLAILAQRAVSAAGLKSQVYAVSRFSNQKARDLLDQASVITVAFDLLQTPDLRQDPNLFFQPQRHPDHHFETQLCHRSSIWRFARSGPKSRSGNPD